MPKACCARWPCPLPRRIERVRVSIASPLMQPSPNGRRVGIRIVTFEACSGFTRVTARRIAQPPKATFVARLRPGQLPDQAARQLPDLSTIIRVEPSSTDDSRLRGALPGADMAPDGTGGCCLHAWPPHASAGDRSYPPADERKDQRPPNLVESAERAVDQELEFTRGRRHQP